MEISLDYETVSTFKPTFCQSKRISVSTECVVSDKCQDISRISFVQKEVTLKSKDINGRSVDIAGEVNFAVLYITETEDKVQWLTFSSDFSAVFDLPEEITAAQVEISVQSSECNVLNPRKVSVNAQLSAQLSAYSAVSEKVECKDVDVKGLHILKQTLEKSVCAGVCEKTFVISEQRVLEKEIHGRVISHSEAFNINEKQVIGSKAIIKGMARLELYLEGDVCPAVQELDIPFSQIIETGAENIFDFSATFIPNAVYADVVETINGEYAVDIEIHALTQLCAYRMQTVVYAQDAYSNLNEIKIGRKADLYMLREKPCTEQIRSRGVLEVGAEIKSCIYYSGEITSLNIQEKTVKAVVCLDILYLTENESYSSVRRYVDAVSNIPGEVSITRCEIESLSVKEAGKNLEYELNVSMELASEKSGEIEYIEQITLSEEEKDRSLLPSLFLVRGESRNVWELAKKYNSTVERIEALNTPEDIKSGKMLMIARSV